MSSKTTPIFMILLAAIVGYIAYAGLEVAGIPDLRPANTLTFSGFEQIIPAAVAAHGVALGRTPLVKDLLASKELVAPFTTSADPARSYFAITSKSAVGRPDVTAFVEWLREEAARR